MPFSIINTSSLSDLGAGFHLGAGPVMVPAANDWFLTLLP